MTGPFIVIPDVGTPVWSVDATTDGNFTDIVVTGGLTIDEVGYGEGGYGEGGYDTPSITIAGSSAPSWTAETTK